ncbi:MAG: efflux RND transporter periplasmic adaptor subunit [Sulfuriferula sp.]
MSTDQPHVTASWRIRIVGIVLLLIAITIAATGILSRMHHEKNLVRTAQLNDITSVNVVRAKLGPSQQTLVLPGNVTPFYEAKIYARVNGYLKMWYTDIGAHVKAGQLMAIIETPELDQQIRSAQADLATAKARLDLADITAKRWQNLLITDSVSRQEVDEKVQGAKAQLAVVNAANANLSSLRAQQAFNHIVAPFDGVVTDRRTDIGSLITTGSSDANKLLFKVADTHKLRVYADVPQNFSSLIKPGLVANLHFPERPGQTFPASYLSTAEAIRENSRTMTVELLMDNRTGELLPGAYADVYFTLGTHANRLVIPASTLLFRTHGLKVATVGPDNRVILKSITLGKDLGNTVEVKSGITLNDQIIDSPSDSIAQGDKVHIHNAGNKS